MPTLTPRHREFIGAVADAAKEHEASADFVLVKKRDLRRTFGEPTATAKKTCILWGYDPATGQPICLQWG